MKGFEKCLLVQSLNIVHMGDKTEISRINAIVKHGMKYKRIVGACGKGNIEPCHANSFIT